MLMLVDQLSAAAAAGKSKRFPLCSFQLVGAKS